MNILHKLKEGFIVTSSEHPNEDEWYLSTENKILKFTGRFCLGDRLPKEWRKIIAQQEQIDFSNLTEEEQKEIGWFDVEKLKFEQYPIDRKWDDSFESGLRSGFVQGFQKAQELLSNRRFTLEELVNGFKPAFDGFINDGGAIGSSKDWIQWQNVVNWFPEFLQSLSQKSWEIEVEMEATTMTRNYSSGKFEDSDFKPKFINGKLKILRIL